MKDMTDKEKRWMPFAVLSFILAIGFYIGSAFVKAPDDSTMIVIAVVFIILAIIFGALSSPKGTV